MKRLLILFLLITGFCYSQNKVLFVDFGAPFTDHDSMVYAAFKTTYNEYGTWDDANAVHIINTGNITQADFDSARTYGCDMIVRSSNNALYFMKVAQNNYPDILLVMPTGSETREELYPTTSELDLPELVLTGVLQNMTSPPLEPEYSPTSAYGYGFSDIDICENLHVSYSNARIASKLKYIKETLNCGWWEVMYRARMSGSVYTNENGFGMIDVSLALAFSDEIIPDQYKLGETPTPFVLEKKESTSSISMTCSTIPYFHYYKLYRNDVLIDSSYTASFTNNYSLTPKLKSEGSYIFNYKIEAVGSDTAKIVSEFQSVINYRKYPKIVVKR